MRIEGISSCVPRNDVIVSLEHFGKTKSILLFESQREVCIERVKTDCFCYPGLYLLMLNKYSFPLTMFCFCFVIWYDAFIQSISVR